MQKASITLPKDTETGELDMDGNPELAAWNAHTRRSTSAAFEDDDRHDDTTGGAKDAGGGKSKGKGKVCI